MRKKHLVIVHLEPDFEYSAGPLDNLVNKVVKYSNFFDKTLNIVSAPMLTNTPPFPQLTKFKAEEWIWGLDIDYYLNDEEEKHNWVEGKNWIRTTGHQYSEILDWMHKLPKDDNYVLVGGGRTECLQDIYDIFKFLNLKVSVSESLTY